MEREDQLSSISTSKNKKNKKETKTTDLSGKKFSGNRPQHLLPEAPLNLLTRKPLSPISKRLVTPYLPDTYSTDRYSGGIVHRSSQSRVDQTTASDCISRKRPRRRAASVRLRAVVAFSWSAVRSSAATRRRGGGGDLSIHYSAFCSREALTRIRCFSSKRRRRWEHDSSGAERKYHHMLFHSFLWHLCLN
jgi:hypothetical protein